jgi:tetratricopeptide (TPR) repeat protein
MYKTEAQTATAAANGIVGVTSRAWTAAAVVSASTFLIYLNTLAFGFVYDDNPQIVRNPAIQGWGHVREYFTSHVWAAIYSGMVGHWYRPLFLLWLRLNYAAWGLVPQWWHLTTVACHVLATYLVFRIAQLVTGDRSIAFLAGILFGLHPAHIESVAWISGVTDPLMAVFFLASLYSYIRYRDGRETLWLAAAVAGFALALLVKETAIVLPLVLVVSEWPGESGERTSIRVVAWRLATSLAPFLAVAALYLVARNSALGGFLPQSASGGWKTMVFTWPSLLMFYFRHLLWPFGLSEFYPSVPTRVSTREFVMSLLLLLLAAGCAVGFVRWLRWSPAIRCAVALLVLPLLPALYSPALTAGDTLHDRYLYLSTAGFSILVAAALTKLAETFSSRAALIRWGIAGVLVIGYSAGTFAQQLPWASDRRLYMKGLESAPDNNTVRDNLADTLFGSGEYDKALPLYLEVLRRDPKFWRSNYNLGLLFYKTANYPDAEKFLTRAVQIAPTDSDEFLYLGLVQMQQGRLDEAIGNARRAIQLEPGDSGYHIILGTMLKRKGLRSEAASELRLGLMLKPGDVGAAQLLKDIDEGK